MILLEFKQAGQMVDHVVPYAVDETYRQNIDLPFVTLTVKVSTQTSDFC
jgi:hypothetical protein